MTINKATVPGEIKFNCDLSENEVGRGGNARKGNVVFPSYPVITTTASSINSRTFMNEDNTENYTC